MSPQAATLETFQARLASIVAAPRAREAHWVAPHTALWQSLQESALDGKQVRPRLLLELHEAFGGSNVDSAVDAACAVELLHLALVIHDDIIDEDLVRRGKPNVAGHFTDSATVLGANPAAARAWGQASALLAGDLALSLAHSTMARLDVPRAALLRALDVFDEAVQVSAAGEHADVWLSLRLEPSSQAIVLSMLEQKTATYSFETPIALAAIIAGCSSETAEALRIVGRHAGLIYQLRDDVLGVFGDEASLGKSTTSDLRAGKETLLVAFARSHHAWNAVENLLGNADLSDVDAAAIRGAMRESGALAQVESLIAEHRTIALERIRALEVPPTAQQRLEALLVTSDERAA